MLKTQSKLFIDPGIDYPIDNLHLSFDDYIRQSTKLITQYRTDLHSPNAEHITAANAPFELRPPQPGLCGALLIHGLLDSPFSMREIGLHLQSQGILSRAIILPGHSTVPGALLHTDYHQWLQAVHYGITSLAKEVKHIFLIGFSTGASAALLHTLQTKINIAGIILISPVLKIHSVFANLTNYYPLFSRIWPRAAWFYQDKNETSDYTRYKSISFNAIYQVYRLTQAIKKSSPSMLPLLFALSKEDNTVCSRATLQYFQQQPHPKNHLLLYSNTNTKISNPRITLRNSIYPKQHISSFSHLALPISPKNLHYGEKNNAAHTIYGEFNPLQISFNEFLFKLKLSQHHYQRLLFNPDFDFLLQSIDKFIRNNSPSFRS